MHAALQDRLQRALAARRDDANLRQCIARPPRSVAQPIDFASNDYLGLCHDPRVAAALTEGLRRYGTGATASAAVCGYTDAHAELEQHVAAFSGRPRALLFSSGYLANLAVAGTLSVRHQRVHHDRLNHASLLDAAILSRARLHRYPHLDVETLARQLADNTDALIVTDGVFSMDGDIAPLPALADIAKCHHATLVVDDAHGIGVIGARGRGSLAHHGVGLAEVPVLVGTFGKALGGAGAFVAGSELLIESLQQFARAHLYTTAMPPAMACAMNESLRIVEAEPERLAALRGNIVAFRECAAAAGLPLRESITAIQPVVVGDNATVARLGAALRERGFWVGAIRPPTVPEGSARLRITLSARHRREDIEALVQTLRRLLPATTS